MRKGGLPSAFTRVHVGLFYMQSQDLLADLQSSDVETFSKGSAIWSEPTAWAFEAAWWLLAVVSTNTCGTLNWQLRSENEVLLKLKTNHHSVYCFSLKLAPDPTPESWIFRSINVASRTSDRCSIASIDSELAQGPDIHSTSREIRLICDPPGNATVLTTECDRTKYAILTPTEHWNSLVYKRGPDVDAAAKN